MHGVSEEDVRAAREMDLLTYLQMCEPWELKQTSSSEYLFFCASINVSLMLS